MLQGEILILSYLTWHIYLVPTSYHVTCGNYRINYPFLISHTTQLLVIKVEPELMIASGMTRTVV